ETGIDEGATQLARAVGAEVGEDDGVAVFHRRAAGNHRRRHELVGFAARISGFEAGDAADFALAVGIDDGLPGALDALPALVSVHAVVASAHAGQPCAGRGVNLRLQSLEA